MSKKARKLPKLLRNEKSCYEIPTVGQNRYALVGHAVHSGIFFGGYVAPDGRWMDFTGSPPRFTT